MPSLIQAIRDVLRPELLLPGPIRLEETDPGSTCGPISLRRHGQTIVIRPDLVAGGVCPRPGCALTLNAPNRLFPMLRLDTPGLTAICDYIVFCQEPSRDDARLFVLLCELKSKNVGGSRTQVENGKLLADYLLATAALHGGARPLPAIERRGIVFSPNYSVPKGSLLRTRCAYASIPGSFPDLTFAYYRCGAEYPIEHFCA